MRAIVSIAKTTIGEAIRRRVLLIILLIGILFLTIAPGLSVLTARSTRTVLISLTLGVIQITSAVIAIVLTVYLIPNEIERRTIYTILSKPVQRWQFLVGKYFGAVGALFLMMSLMTVTLLAVFIFLQQGAPQEEILELVRVPVLFFVQMCLLAAVAIFFSTFVSPIVNFFLSGGTFLLGSLFNSLLEAVRTGENTGALTRIGAQILHSIIPNFQNFNVQNPLINPGQTIEAPGIYAIRVTAYAVVYITVLLIAGIIIFDRREV